jgi:hypothetical protein
MLADAIAEHLEELPGEWARRGELLRSPRAYLRDLRRLDERIAGRLDALRLADVPAPATPPDEDPPGSDLVTRAALAGPDDVEAILARCAEPALGPERFAALASLGSPRGVPRLLAAMADNDHPADAVAAGAAFARLIGERADSDLLWTPPRADEFDAAFVVAVPLPDAAAARAAWDEARPRLEHATRIAGGQDLAGEIDADELDLLTLREIALRAGGEALAAHARFTAALVEPLADGERL